MTNCEECVYYEYDPETDSGDGFQFTYDAQKRIWTRTIWSGFCVPPMMPVPFTAPETNTARRGGSERPKAGITPGFSSAAHP